MATTTITAPTTQTLTDKDGHVWSFGDLVPGASYIILRDGTPYFGGFGYKMTLSNGVIWVLNQGWYMSTPTGWDGPKPAPPVPDAQPPTSLPTTPTGPPTSSAPPGRSIVPPPLRIDAVRPGVPQSAFPPQLYFFNDLNRRFQQTSTRLIVTGKEALNLDIDNILECPPKSFMFHRDFGARIKSVLFEPMNDITANKLKILFIEAIERWEPRVRIIFPRCVVIPYYDNHLYLAVVSYVIIANNEIAQYVRTMATQVGS
jgi:phage baseplate assembly protein W